MAAVRLQAMLSHLRTLAVEDQSDGQLLGRFAAERDEAAFEALLRRHGGLVLSVCRRLLGNGPDVDDAFQATFLVLARRAGSIRKQTSVASWLYGVAVRLARRLHNQRARRRQREQGTESLGHIAENRPMRVDPTSRASLRELGTLLDEELLRLPAKYREAVVLCHLEGLSTSEAAKQLGWSLGTLKSRVKRGRELIRTRLMQRGVTLSAGGLAVALAEQAASAALPARMLRAARDGGVAFALKPVPGAAVSAQAAALAQSMTLSKFPLAVLALALTGLVCLAATLLPASAPGAPPPADNTPPITPALQPPKVVVDAHGDPLPPGAVARLGTIRWRHGGNLEFLAYLPDGKQLLSAGEDRAIRLWELATGKEIRRFGPCTPPPPGADAFTNDFGRLGATAVALSADGKTLAASFDQPTIRLWDVVTGKELAAIALKDFGGPANCLALAPDAPQVAVATPDGKVYIWDWKTGKILQRLNRITPKNDQQLLTTNGHLRYCPDGKGLLAVTAQVNKNGNAKTYLTLWDPHTGKERIKIYLDSGPLIGGPVLSRDGQRVAVTADPGPVRVFDLVTGKSLCTFEVPDASVLFSDDGKKLFTKSVASPGVQEWDLATGKEARPLLKPREPQDLAILRGGGLGGLALSPDGKTIAAGDEGNAIRFIDVASGQLQPTLGVHANALSVVSFTADGKLLTHGSEAAAFLWDPRQGRVVKEIRPPAGTADFLPSPDGRLIAALGNDNVLTLTETAGGKVVGKIADVRPYERIVMFAPDSRTLLVHNPSQTTAVLYDPASGKQRCTVTVPAFIPTQSEVSGPGNVRLPPIWVFSPDGKLLVGYVEKNVLAVWDTSAGRVRQKLACPQGVPVRSGGISPDNSTLALDLADGRVALWELATGQERATLGKRREGEPESKAANAVLENDLPMLGSVNAMSVVFSPDGRMLAQAAAGQPLRLWDVQSGQVLAEFAGHQGMISALAFAPRGRTLVSGSWDTTALVWDIQAAHQKAGPVLRELDAAAAAACWSDLTAKDAVKAWQAICKLSASPEQAVALVKQHVQPAPPLDGAKVQELLTRLDSSKYKERQEAIAELFQLGERVLPPLEKVLANHPPLETRKRVEELVERLTGLPLTAKQVQELRAVEVLQSVDTPQARKVLEHLAAGAPGAQVTVSAQAALARTRR